MVDLNSKVFSKTTCIAFMGAPCGGADKKGNLRILHEFATVFEYDTDKKIPEALNPASEVLAYLGQEFRKHLRFCEAVYETSPVYIDHFCRPLAVDLQILGFKATDAGS